MTLPNVSEIGWTRAFACVAIIIITLFLAALNVTGAWAASGNIFYTGVVLGVELLAAVCLVLILDAPTKARKIVGALVFAALIYVCVENGKMAIEKSFSGIFVDSPVALREKARLAQEEADGLKASAPADRTAVQNEIAELKVELDLMTSETRIADAQKRLTALGLYTGRIDGLRQNLTEDAMRKRGEQIRKRLEILTARAESNATPAGDRGVAAIEFKAQADEIEQRTVWMNLLLFAVEGARSAGFWAFVIWTTGRRRVVVDPDVFKDLQAQADELARRKANLGEGAEKAVKTKTRKKNREQSLKMIADQRAESVKREEIQKAVDAEAALDKDGEFQEPEVEPQPEAEPELEIETTEASDPVEPIEAVNDDTDQPEEKAA